MATTPTNPVLAGCSDEEIRRRLDGLAVEYDGLVRTIASTTVKANHVRQVIEELLDEFDRRSDR